MPKNKPLFMPPAVPVKGVKFSSTPKTSSKPKEPRALEQRRARVKMSGNRSLEGQFAGRKEEHMRSQTTGGFIEDIVADPTAPKELMRRGISQNRKNVQKTVKHIRELEETGNYQGKTFEEPRRKKLGTRLREEVKNIHGENRALIRKLNGPRNS